MIVDSAFGLINYHPIEISSGSLGEREMLWNTSRRQVLPQLFRVLPNFHECSHNSVETWRTWFLFLLENTATKKRETTCLVWSSKCKFSLLAPSLRQQLVLVLCFYRVLETIQRAYFPRAVFGVSNFTASFLKASIFLAYFHYFEVTFISNWYFSTFSLETHKKFTRNSFAFRSVLIDSNNEAFI